MYTFVNCRKKTITVLLFKRSWCGFLQQRAYSRDHEVIDGELCYSSNFVCTDGIIELLSRTKYLSQLRHKPSSSIRQREGEPQRQMLIKSFHIGPFFEESGFARVVQKRQQNFKREQCLIPEQALLCLLFGYFSSFALVGNQLGNS